MEQKGGFEIRNSQDFETLMNRFLSDTVYLQTSGKAAGDYVKNNSGALEKIMEYMKL